MDRLAALLDVHLLSFYVRDEARTPYLMRLGVVADDDMHACKLRPHTVAREPMAWPYLRAHKETSTGACSTGFYR